MKAFSSLVFLIFLALESQAQLKLLPYFGQEVLQVDKSYFINEKDSITISSFRFYLSQLEFIKANGERISSSKKHFLIDLEDPQSLNLSPSKMDLSQFVAISFLVGVDSLTNASGAQAGDLDPMNGMYWSWQSGYINFKLEGKSNLCPARKNKFQFHLGGFLAPYKPIQKVVLQTAAAESLQIKFDIAKFIEGCDIKTNYQIMSPSEESVELSKIAASLFRIKDD